MGWLSSLTKAPGFGIIEAGFNPCSTAYKLCGCEQESFLICEMGWQHALHRVIGGNEKAHGKCLAWYLRPNIELNSNQWSQGGLVFQAGHLCVDTGDFQTQEPSVSALAWGEVLAWLMDYKEQSNVLSPQRKGVYCWGCVCSLVGVQVQVAQPGLCPTRRFSVSEVAPRRGYFVPQL